MHTKKKKSFIAMPIKKKIKTRIASKKDAALVETMVRVIRNAEKKSTPKEKLVKEPSDSLTALRRDLISLQEVFTDRINRLEDKIGAVRMIVDDTKRDVVEQKKSLDERLDQMATSVNERLEKEGKRHTRLVKTVYKEHNDELIKIRRSVSEMEESATNKAQIVDADIQFIAKEMSSVKDAVNEL